MNKLIACSFAALALCGCGQKEAPNFLAVIHEHEPLYKSDDLSFAVMESIQAKLHFESGKRLSPDEAQCLLKVVEEQRRWALTLSNLQVKGEYLQWLDFYTDEIHKAATAVETDSEHDLRELHEKVARAAILRTIIPQPPESKEHCVKGEKL